MMARGITIYAEAIAEVVRSLPPRRVPRDDLLATLRELGLSPHQAEEVLAYALEHGLLTEDANGLRAP